MISWLRDKWKELKLDLAKSHKSLTILFNTSLAGIAFAIPELIAFIPQLQDYLPEADYKKLMIVALVGNFILRFKTTKAVRDK